uniref:C3H1-type domain-containing protein n=1 Tax=Pyrodinium bahamense TaxID=73915 RepID=A0A7S0FMW7_9DINO
MAPGGSGGASCNTMQEWQLHAGPVPPAGAPPRQFLSQAAQVYVQQGCYMGELVSSNPLQFHSMAVAPPPILSTSPKVGGASKARRGGMPRQRALASQGARDGGRQVTDWKAAGQQQQPVPPGFISSQQLPGNAGMMLTPSGRWVQDQCAPSAALGLLEAFPTNPGLAPSLAEAPMVGCVDPLGGLPAPLLIRNTFLDAKPVRSPSLDPFFEERKVKSSPPSGPPSGKLEVAAPRSTLGGPPPPYAGFVPAVSLADALPPPGGCAAGSLYPYQQEQGAQPGMPAVWQLAEGTACPLLPCFDTDCSTPGTPEPTYREAWQPTPVAQTCGGSSSGGSAEVAASSASAGCSAVLSDQVSPAAAGRRETEPVVLGSPELPSRGSALHKWGACKPCAFVFQEGCNNDVECQFCHLCEPGERKRRKKERLAMKREVREAARRRRAEAAAAQGGGWRPRGGLSER